jgi:trans-aconitate methyltransferase
VDRKEHWEQVYGSRSERDVSWFETVPELSIQMIEAAGVNADTCIVDIGGGDSHLIDELLARGLDCLAVLDVSDAALGRAQARVGQPGAVVTWIRADVTQDWSLKPMDIWHDRAVFHFLTTPEDRSRYLARLRDTLKPRGTAIVATFAPDGPEKCSGLPVERYSPQTLAAQFGGDFELVDAKSHTHRTPWGASQHFQYSRLLRVR